MVLVASFTVDGTFHKVFLRNIQLSQTVDYDMYMDIAAAVMPVHVGTDQCLMARKICFYIFHADGLRSFSCESAFIFIRRIEADEIMMCLDFIIILIFIVLCIEHFTLYIKKFWFTVDAIQQNIPAEHPVSICIQQRFLQDLIVLIFQIVECRTVVCAFTCDVF